MAQQGYRSSARIATSTSTTNDPYIVERDIKKSLRTISPTLTPLYWLGAKLGRGAKPVSHKVEYVEYYETDPFDTITVNAVGAANEERFARITFSNTSRPGVTGEFYHLQDVIAIIQSNQTVEVVMTSSAAKKFNGTELTLPTSITGNTTTRSAAGSVVVRVITPDAFRLKANDTADTMWLQRTIFEGQPVEAEGRIRNYEYDFNYVEHKEAIVKFTDDQLWQRSRFGNDMIALDKTQTLKEFQMAPEHSAFLGQRAINLDNPGKPTRYMGGLLENIKTNVSYYNPTSVTDFETLVINFLHEQVFKQSVEGANNMTKLAFCGRNFLLDLNQSFQSFRQNTNVSGDLKKVGMNVDTYVLPGGYTVSFTANDVLRKETPMGNWCFVVTPNLAEWRIVKDFSSKYVEESRARIKEWMTDWQGTITWEGEQAHALLRT